MSERVRECKTQWVRTRLLCYIVNYTIERASLVHFNAAVNLPYEPVAGEVADGAGDDEEGERHNSHVP